MFHWRECKAIPFAIIAEIIVTCHIDNATPTLEFQIGITINWFHLNFPTSDILPGPNEKNICTAASAQT